MTIKASIIWTLMVLILLICSPAYTQEDMATVDPDAFENPQRPAARFRHDDHNETAGIEACNECHHVYDEDGHLVEDESSEDQRCSECHEAKSTGRSPGLREAFHFNCKGCHQERNTGPVMCGQCHVRHPEETE